MCVIVVKENMVRLPSYNELRNCFNNNSDGAGFMYLDKGKVVVDKGYMTFNKFYKRYEKLCKKYDNFKNLPLILHFRIGTSSGNTKENTHPYPIYENTKEMDLHKTYLKSDLAMVHNGIISDYTPKIKNPTTNDTQEFVLKYLTPLYKNYKNFYENEYILKGLEDITNSKLAFLNKDGNIYLVGKYEVVDGLKFSNSSYVDYGEYYLRYSTPKSYAYGDYDYKESFINGCSSLIDLKPSWYICENETIHKVGNRLLAWDYETNILYEYVDNELVEISNNAFIYDENYELIY